MNELFEAVKTEVGKFLTEKGYVKRGKNDFVKKGKLYKREEVITFSSVSGKAPRPDITSINITSGIYYKEVNSLDKKIIKDFFNSYPIVSGSIGHFKNENSGYFSVPINQITQVNRVSKEIIETVELGAFNLFKKYSTLEDILKAIDKKEDWLKDYHKFLNFRESIRLAAIYCLTYNKNEAIEWFNNNAPDNVKKAEALELLKNEW
ncbi:hypothetical protein [Zobellia laminariae]|uniref:hypothetical protein n=1 Tax=Zobellia laminariae TaxID=248906 RepID=UPI0026F427BC|nr:hypothetical protein [Zobellia laminariae]WKX76207.1 hypothetical protein Q5W13_21995 [Zobellia laminariae]